MYFKTKLGLDKGRLKTSVSDSNKMKVLLRLLDQSNHKKKEIYLLKAREMTKKIKK
jgi:hypothetical protein